MEEVAKLFPPSMLIGKNPLEYFSCQNCCCFEGGMPGCLFFFQFMDHALLAGVFRKIFFISIS